jgi:hypothetical protein
MSLYSSSNFKEYKKIAFFENHFGQFYVNPYNSKEVFFVSNEGEKSVFKSINQGYSWQKVYNSPADNLVFHPSNKNELFLVKNNTAQGTEIIKSNDSGVHWNKMTSIKEISWAYQIVIDPMNYEHFLIPARNGLWESLNGGLSWKQIYQESEPSMAIFDPAENNKAYFVAKDSSFELHNGNIKKFNFPKISAPINGCGIACQTSTKRIFVIIVWQKNKDTGYYTTIYQVKNDSLTPITQVKSKDRTTENIIFDNTNPNVMYFYSYKTIYKVNL